MHYRVEAKVIGMYYVHVEASSERSAQRKAMDEIEKGMIRPIEIKEIECLDVKDLSLNKMAIQTKPYKGGGK